MTKAIKWIKSKIKKALYTGFPATTAIMLIIAYIGNAEGWRVLVLLPVILLVDFLLMKDKDGEAVAILAIFFAVQFFFNI